MWGGLPDVFLKIEFQDDRLINVGAVGGRNLTFPIDKAHLLYNSLLLPHKPWQQRKHREAVPRQQPTVDSNKKAQLSLTNPHDPKACQKLLEFDVLTTLSLTYWPIFMRLASVAYEICEIPRNSLKIQTYEVQGHPRSSIFVSIESP